MKKMVAVPIFALCSMLYAQERVSFTTSDKVDIVGTYTKAVAHKICPMCKGAKDNGDGKCACCGVPMEESKSAPHAIVLLHMLRKDRSDWNDFTKKLSNEGYAVLAIDIRGHGESTKPRTDFNMATNDVKSAVEYLKKQGVDEKRVAIIGASIGANIALNYAASDTNVKAVALLSPGLDYHEVKTEDAMKKYGKRSVLMVASKDDSAGYSLNTVEKLFDIATGDKQKQIYEKSGHGTDIFGKEDKDEPKLENVILDWLKKVL